MQHLAPPESEFQFTDRDFERIRILVKTRAGIELGPEKRALAYGRLARRLRALGLPKTSAYLKLIEDEAHPEAGHFINALTTNVTEFFRENHHFDFLARDLLPSLWKKHQQDRRVRFWSAGCSTGEEPYSLAMTVAENTPSGPWDIKILATDLNSNVLDFASAGVYAAERTDKVSRARLGRWFTPTAEGHQVAPDLRSLVTFKPLNLISEPWPMKGPFDVIFCRNVTIYFDAPTKQRLLRRFRGLLADDGYLIVGHSESMVNAGLGFEPSGRTIYRKKGTGET